MGKIKERITILTIGDRSDYDSHRKLHKEKFFIGQSGFDYITTNYDRFLYKDLPEIKTRKVLIFLFFPFDHWNKSIENRHYKGTYGNRTFFKKFLHFWFIVEKKLKSSLRSRELFFINQPALCALYRDKGEIARKFLRAKIPNPKQRKILQVKHMTDLLRNGHEFFLKPRYGSMGKGITFLSWENWKTNFVFKNNKIISRRSDRGWKFRDITGNARFLGKLLKEDILIEDAVKSVLLKDMKIDMRVYVFFNKVIYVYPRKNKKDNITTNISQGAKGDPTVLEKIPKTLIKKIKKTAQRVSKILGLNWVGMDIMIDQNLKDIYVIDVNVFPGFPKRRTFNMSKYMMKEIKKLTTNGRIRFDKNFKVV